MSWPPQNQPYNPAYDQGHRAAQPVSGAAPRPHNPGHSLPPAGSSAGYGRVPGAPPGVSAELWGWFQSVDADHSGTITATELRQALVNTNWSHFNEETCRLLIGMFDSNRDGTIDVHEFAALWKYVQEWKGCFDRFDTDKSGNIDAAELHQALTSFGYMLSVQFCQLCTRVFDRGNCRTMKFDDFIQCCVMLRSLTEAFKRKDQNRSGVITISYEEFLEMAIDNTI